MAPMKLNQARAYLVQHRRHRDVGLACTGGCAHQQVSIAVEGGLVDLALDAVELPAPPQSP